MTSDAHTNFMGGECYELFNPIQALRLPLCSQFLGEPSYYMPAKDQEEHTEIKGILKPIEIGKEESQKRVTFEVKEKTSNEKSPTQETTTFFSRLKQRSNSSDRELLQQIIENQKTLMEQNSTILKHLNKSNTASLSTDN